MKRATFPVLLLGVLALSSFAFALETPHRFRKGEWETTLRTGYLYTDSNFIGSGGPEALPDSGSYQLIEGDLTTRYVFSPDWALWSALTLSSAESRGRDANRTNTSVTGALIGLEWRWNAGAVDFAPEISFVFPFESNVLDQDTVMNSEGVNETRLRLHGSVPFREFTLFGRLGYDMRDGGRSNLMPWSLGIEFGKSTRYGARLYGSQSISDDSDTGGFSETARWNTSTRVNAGSLKYYAVNPSSIDAEGFLIFPLSRRWDLGFAGGLTFAGQNTAAEYRGEAALTFRFSTEPVRRVKPAQGDRISVDPYVDHFREDIDDGVDQEVFKPIRPAPVRPRKRVTPDDNESREMQQQLDDTEMSIELKSDRPLRKRKK